MVRSKHRYFVLNTSENVRKINHYELRNNLIQAVTYLHGDFGAAAIRNGLNVAYVSKTTNIAMVKVRRGPHRLVASALPILIKSNPDSYNICTLYVGATIKQCLLYIKNYQLSEYDKVAATLNEDERMDVRREYMNYKKPIC